MEKQEETPLVVATSKPETVNMEQIANFYTLKLNYSKKNIEKTITILPPLLLPPLINDDGPEVSSGSGSSLSLSDIELDNGNSVESVKPTLHASRTVTVTSQNGPNKMSSGGGNRRNSKKNSYKRVTNPIGVTLGHQPYHCDNMSYDGYNMVYQPQVISPYPVHSEMYGCTYAYPVNGNNSGNYFDPYNGQYPTPPSMATGGGYTNYGTPAFCTYRPQYTKPIPDMTATVGVISNHCRPSVTQVSKKVLTSTLEDNTNNTTLEDQNTTPANVAAID